jgi:hypothetical protein
VHFLAEKSFRGRCTQEPRAWEGALSGRKSFRGRCASLFVICPRCGSSCCGVAARVAPAVCSINESGPSSVPEWREWCCCLEPEEVCVTRDVLIHDVGGSIYLSSLSQNGGYFVIT